MPNFRLVGRILLGLFIAGILLFYGDRIYQEQFSLRPAESFLSELSGVASFEWETKAGEELLIIELTPDAQLDQVVPEVEKGMVQHLRRPPRLVVYDQRTPDLIEALGLLRFDLEEALVTGNFSELPAAGERVRQQEGLEHVKISIDERHLYVTLKNDEDFLYEILDRPFHGPNDRGETTSKSSLWV